MKSDALSTFVQLKSHVEKYFNCKIKALQIDGGAEYKKFNPYLCLHGIQHRLSCLHMQEQNGQAEHKHCHVVKLTSRCLPELLFLVYIGLILSSLQSF